MNVLWVTVSLCVLLNGNNVKSVDVNDVDMTGWTPFNCNRAASGCYNAGTCNPDGTCTCTDSNVYDCSIPSGTPTCGNTCNGKGTCYTLTSGDTCHCEPEYAGDNCDRARGYVQCNDGSMSVEIYPQSLPVGNFQGRLTVQQRGSNEPLTNDACVIDLNESGVWAPAENRFRTVYSTVDDAAQNPCLDGLVLTADSNEACYNIRLWYNAQRQTYVDEVFTMCCSEDTNINDGQATVGNGDGNDSGAKINASVEIVDGTLIHTVSGNEVLPTDTLTVGDPISFVVDVVDPVSRYQYVRINSCTASPGDIALVTNRCRDPNALDLVSSLTQNGKAIYVNMRAWNPTGADQITVTCDTIACVTEADCGGPPATCPGDGSQALGRKKREVNETSEGRESFTTTATYRIEVNVDSCPAQQPCPTSAHMNMVFIPVAVVFGVLLVVAFGISLFLCLRLRRSDRSESRGHPPAYDNHAMTKA